MQLFPIVALLGVGVALRVSLAMTLPVGYDESYVMGLGLVGMQESVHSWLIDVPLTHSSALTPLWWWVQYVPLLILPDISLFALRVVPVLLGLLTLGLSWYTAAKRFGRPIALVFLGFVVFSGILIFTNSRGEFSESLTVPLIIVLACGIRSGETKKGALLRGVLWTLLLLTGLVKGIFVIALMLLAQAVLLFAGRRPWWFRLRGLAISLVLAALPVLAYLLWAQASFGDRPIEHEAMTAPNVWALARGLLFDYTAIKQQVTGSARDAAFIALDFAVWPATVLTAPLLVAACISALVRFVRDGFRAVGRLAETRVALAVWSIVGAVVIICRGSLGARFHLMYLPAAWLLAAIWLTHLRNVRPVKVVVAGLGWAVYVGFAASWSDWTGVVISPGRWAVVAGILAIIVAVSVGLAVRARRSPVRVTTIALAYVAVASLLIAGPLKWADFSRFEPMPRGKELAKLDAYRSGKAPYPEAHGRTLYIDLANYYLVRTDGPPNPQKALRFSRLEVQRVPRDPRAWVYLGESLLRAGADLEKVHEAWMKSYELAPIDSLKRRIEELEAQMHANATPR